MKYILTATASLCLLAASAASAQPPDQRDKQAPAKPGTMMMMKGPAMSGPSNHGAMMMMKGPAPHADWHKGGHIETADWKRGQKIDYRQQHLQRPPRGYEWRQVDGNFVLAAAATGLIASIIAASH